MTASWQTTRPSDHFDVLAPDGSEIRLLVEVAGGSMVHCTLPPGKVTQAVRHRTVEEVWFFLSGQGEVWRKSNDGEELTGVGPGMALSIPLGTSFSSELLEMSRCGSSSPRSLHGRARMRPCLYQAPGRYSGR